MTLLIKTGDNYGLCNRIYPFANLIACATEHGFRVEHAAFFEFARYFLGTSQTVIPSIPAARYTRTAPATEFRRSFYRLKRRAARKAGLEPSIVLRSNDICDLSDPQILDQLRANRRTQLNGLYFFDSENFPKHADLVREFFTPVMPIQRQVTRVLAQARDLADVVVGVHVRQGDYEFFADGILFYTQAQYRELIDSVECLFPDQVVAYLICSNVKLEPGRFHGPRMVRGPGHLVADLYALAGCDYIVGPDSTYSEWASFYGQVPRYIHSKNALDRMGQTWSGLSLSDFHIADTGFGRCAATHMATLR